MSDKIIENNQVSIIGEVVSGFVFSHEVFGEGFYMLDVSVRRLSDSCDVIPLMISERLIDVNADYRGACIRAAGQFRSYNRHEEKKNRLVLSVFVRELEFMDEEVENSKTNQIFLDGYIWRFRICCLQSTGLMASRTTFRVSAGEEMQDLPQVLKWEATRRSGDGSRAGNI